MLLIQDQLSFRMTKNDRQVRIGVQDFGRKLGMYVGWLRSSVSALTGTKANESQLVVLTALELKCPAVSSVWENGFADIGERQRRAESARVSGREASNDLSEE
jgi:hypothetical protein